VHVPGSLSGEGLSSVFFSSYGNVRPLGPRDLLLLAARETVFHCEHSRILADYLRSHEKPAANLDGFSC
jgi:hypothetical protein